MKLGFVGLGTMGRPMATRLLRAGHELAVWARRPEAAAPLVAAGATPCASAAEVARRSEIVFTIVTYGRDVEAVVFGDDGLAAGFAPDSILVDMSTIAPGLARDIASRLAAQGVHMLDAPVSGGGVGAAAGTLAIMAGGEAAVLERVRPLFAVLGKTLVHVGGNGAGQVAKACNQMVMVAAIEAAAEAMRLAAAAGVDPEKVRQALAGGSAGSRVLEVFGARMTQRDFAAGVEARLHHKDFGIVLQEAHAMGVPLPVTAAVGQQLNALMAQGWGGCDTASLLRVLERSGD
ncbi:NAD(P)-dependent oxidoreductase [Azospira restricta]|uniref:NAD(P)-dependent oxidoreductase n=1 Tax=Azospira restricta TaxID=404405 RepID=A0A974SRL8_9RHOO|nr:NAD(P)-dependent oxidoreductase [Azospira restricta]QRJ65236.1 NAD(P)-dependent oxidoreductase [Azospira restricta]